MKAKVIFTVFVIAVLFVLGMIWLLNHAYIVVTFWLAIKVMLTMIALFFAGLLIGRLTAPTRQKHNEYPPQAN